MQNTQIDIGSTYYLELFVTDAIGDPVIGLSVTYKVYNSDTDAIFDSGSLTDVGNGTYKKSIIFTSIGQYRIIYTTPTNYTDEIEGVLVVEAAVSEDLLKRILGLCQENYRILNPLFDKNHNLIGGIIKIYPSATDLESDTNAIATYSIESGFNLTTNLMQYYKVKRTS